jgi:hypothetical protein
MLQIGRMIAKTFPPKIIREIRPFRIIRVELLVVRSALVLARS